MQFHISLAVAKPIVAMSGSLFALALVHGAAALLVPLPPNAPLVRAAVAPAAVSAASYASPFPVSTLLANDEAPVKKVSAAKAKIEAAKLAQQACACMYRAPTMHIPRTYHAHSHAGESGAAWVPNPNPNPNPNPRRKSWPRVATASSAPRASATLTLTLTLPLTLALT